MGLESADTVVVVRWKLVGTRDLTVQVLESFDDAEVLVHGISISPANRPNNARRGSKAVFACPVILPSAMVVAEIFLTPFWQVCRGNESFRDHHSLCRGGAWPNVSRQADGMITYG